MRGGIVRTEVRTLNARESKFHGRRLHPLRENPAVGVAIRLACIYAPGKPGLRPRGRRRGRRVTDADPPGDSCRVDRGSRELKSRLRTCLPTRLVRPERDLARPRCAGIYRHVRRKRLPRMELS